jgi:hypothetical protein
MPITHKANSSFYRLFKSARSESFFTTTRKNAASADQTGRSVHVPQTV